MGARNRNIKVEVILQNNLMLRVDAIGTLEEWCEVCSALRGFTSGFSMELADEIERSYKLIGDSVKDHMNESPPL